MVRKNTLKSSIMRSRAARHDRSKSKRFWIFSMWYSTVLRCMCSRCATAVALRP